MLFLFCGIFRSCKIADVNELKEVVCTSEIKSKFKGLMCFFFSVWLKILYLIVLIRIYIDYCCYADHAANLFVERVILLFSFQIVNFHTSKKNEGYREELEKSFCVFLYDVFSSLF